MKRRDAEVEDGGEEEPKWYVYMRTLMDHIEPIRKRPATLESSQLPQIVNLVSTVELLPQGHGYKLPLHAIARALPCAQYAPVMFAANILKLSDSIGECTPLVFASGKIVVVSGQTPYHTLWMSQLTRYVIEQVQCAMRNPDTGEVNPCGSLVGRTTFKDCCIHNIVGHARLGCRINLQAMCEAAPGACKWVPDLFPGLKCRMWLTTSGRCECGKPKCLCSIKVLVFDTGRIVITGGRSIRDVNSIYFRIRAIAPEFASGNSDTVIPREDRFYQRLSSMLVPTGLTGKEVERVAPGEMSEDEALATLFEHQAKLSGGNIQQQQSIAAAEPEPPPPAGTTALMRMADAGRVEEIKFLLACEPDAALERDASGRNALQRLRLIPSAQRSPQQQAVIEVLMHHQ